MSEPDIIEDLGKGIIRTTVIQAVEITRQGKDGGWRVSLPLVREVTLPDGSIAPQPAAPVTYDVADLAAADPTIMQAFALIRDFTIRMARGDLKPLPPVEESNDQ
jgi:hypothetical protein